MGDSFTTERYLVTLNHDMGDHLPLAALCCGGGTKQEAWQMWQHGMGVADTTVEQWRTERLKGGKRKKYAARRFRITITEID